MLSRTVKRGDEEFEVAVSEDSKTATVTDKLGTIASISYNSGHLNVRLPNGWGAWKSSMPSAVDYAVDLCLEARGQLTSESAFQGMVDYVKGGKNGGD